MVGSSLAPKWPISTGPFLWNGSSKLHFHWYMIPFLSEAVETSRCYFFKNRLKKLKCPNLLKPPGTLILKRYWSYYPWSLTPWSENANNYFGFFATHFLTISMYNLTFFILISKWILVNVTGKTMVNTMRDMEYQVTKTILITCISFVLLNVPTALIMMFDPMPPKGDLPWLHILGK